MKALRALTAARLQVLWNTVHRGRGLLGLLAAVAVVVIGLACLVPPGAMFVVFGKVLGEDLAAADSPAMTWLAGLHALIVFGLGVLAGTRRQAGFDRELLRMHPLPRVQVVLAELPFNLLDTIPILGVTFFAGLHLGLAQVLPGQGPALLLLFVQAVLSLLLVQQLVGVLRRLASRSKRLLLGLLLPLAGVAVASQLGVENAPMLMVDYLPTSAGYHALRAAELGSGGVLGYHLVIAAFNLLLFGLLSWLQVKELGQDPPLRVDTGVQDKLWTFRRPAAGIARLFVAQVAGSRHGKILLGLPAFCTILFVACAQILSNSAEGREDSSGFLETALALLAKLESQPLYFFVPLVTALFMGELWLNQFAWDGNGYKSLMLAPLRTTELLAGKLRGLLMLVLPQGLVATLPLLRRSLPEIPELVAGLAGAACAITALGGFGHLLSAWFPRPHRGQGEGAVSAPPLLGLLSTAAMLAVGAGGGAVWFLAGRFGDWGPAIAFAAGTLALLLLHRLLLPALARRVDDARELIVETLA